MGYKEVGGTKEYPKFADFTKGDTIVEGVYRKEFEGKYGPQGEYLSDDGAIVVLNHHGQLAYKMDFIKPGSKVKIIYDGMIKLTKGKMAGKNAHQFIVMEDEDFEVEGDEGVASTKGLSDEGLDEFNDL